MKKIPVILIALFTITMIACNTTPSAEVADNAEGVKTINQASDAKPMAKTVALLDGYNVGDTAEDIKLMGTDDKEHSFTENSEAKGFIVTFTCNTCPYSVMYEDRLIDLHRKYADLGYPVVAINPNDPEVKPGDSFDAMKDRVKEKNFPFLYLFDEGQQVYPKFGASRTPHVFLLDNNLVVKYIGAIDDNARDAAAVKTKYLEDAIDAMEAGNDPDPSFTKAIGCTIKTKKS